MRHVHVAVIAAMLVMLVGACLEGRTEDCGGMCANGSICDVATGQCTCLAGRSDCNGDRNQIGGDGCECAGTCDGAVCAAGSACLPGPVGSCSSVQWFCSPTTSRCEACLTGTYNCDGNNGNGCEASVPCGAAGCSSCSQMSYCNASTQQCVSCPTGRYNCDGQGENACEEARPCGSSPCDIACQNTNDDDCVWDTSLSQCVPCLEDAHCQGNPRSTGPYCDEVAKLCVCKDSGECVGLSAGSACVQATLYEQVCGCEDVSDCTIGEYSVCAGAGVKKCTKP